MSNLIPLSPPSGVIADVEIAILDAQFAVKALSASGAIPVASGHYTITKAGVAALTLATPVAGLPSVGGDDGKKLVLQDVLGHAHTVTTATNKINGNTNVLTFAGVPGQVLELRAYNGVWYTDIYVDAGGPAGPTGPKGDTGDTGATGPAITNFNSLAVTGTGSEQEVAHGLGVVPSAVLVVPTDGGTVVQGTHTSTNVVFTGDEGKLYDILALS